MTNIYRISKTLAIFLWGMAVGVLVNAIIDHRFWTELTPVIAHNHIENYWGWLIVIAFCFSILSLVSKILTKSK